MAVLPNLLCNTQSELHPLEEGKHAAESGMNLKEYAEAVGKVRATLNHKVHAWRVFSLTHMGHDQARTSWRNLAEIHAAPKWLWAALAERMIEKEWTVEQMRKSVAWAKDIPMPPEWSDVPEVARLLVSGEMKKTVGVAHIEHGAGNIAHDVLGRFSTSTYFSW